MQEDGGAVGAHQYGRGVTTAGQGDVETASVFVGGEEAEDDGAEAGVGAVVLVVEDGVEVGEYGGGVGVVDGGGAQRVAGQGGDGRRGGALAAHVAQEQPPGAGREGEEVVEVAADLVGGRDVVVRGDFQAGDVHQLRRQQGLLQGGVQVLEAVPFEVGLLACAQ